MTEHRETPEAELPKGMWIQFALEFGPLVLFFMVNKFADIFWATGSFMVAMALAMIVSKKRTGKISTMQWVTFGIVMVMGGLTLYLQDERFVKIKPTLIYGILAVVLGFGLVTGNNYLKLLLGEAMPALTMRGWRIITRNWVLFFAAMAGANEAIWRNVSTDTWVTIKSFGFFGAAIVFAGFQGWLMMRHLDEEKPAE